MDDQAKHSASFPPPVFASRVLRARMLIEAAGLRFIWNAPIGEHVLSDRKTRRNRRATGSNRMKGGDHAGISNGTCSCESKKKLDTMNADYVKTTPITSPDVSTPKAFGAGTPLYAISRSNWSPESAEVRPLFKAPREDGSWFHAELDCS